MISVCVVPTVKHGGGGGMVWGCFAGDSFRIQGTLNQHGYNNILKQYIIPSGLLLVWLLFFNRTMTQHTPPGCVRAIWTRRRVMDCCMRWPGLHNHLTSTQSRWFGMSWTAECLAYAGTPSRLLEKHSRWLPHKAGWENAKSVQSCRQGKVWILWRISYIFICLTLFWLLHGSICVIS